MASLLVVAPHETAVLAAAALQPPPELQALAPLEQLAWRHHFGCATTGCTVRPNV